MNVLTINKNYTTTYSDYYIGVSCETPITITLLPYARDGQEYVIKLQMKPPIGKRLITITTIDKSTIDGYLSHLMQVSHDYVRLIRNDGNWYKI